MFWPPLTIGEQMFPDNAAKAALADQYLRENVKYALASAEVAGLRRFYELAAEVGALASGARGFITGLKPCHPPPRRMPLRQAGLPAEPRSGEGGCHSLG